MQDPDKKIHPILKRYANGEVSAYNAATEVQDLNIPGYEDPSAGDVVFWSKQMGYGIPAPTAEEAQAEAAAFLKKQKA